MSAIEIPKPDPRILARRDAIVAGLAALLPPTSLITEEDERRAYETDALTAYRQMPLAVVLPETTAEVSAILAFLNALFVTAASIIATAMFIIFRNVISSVREINIGANVGVTMFAFMWVASAFAIFAWLVQTGLCCCCASRRDVKTGRKRGNEKAYGGADGVVMRGADGGEAKGKRTWGLGKRSA